MANIFLEFSVNFSKIDINRSLGHFMDINHWLDFIAQSIVLSYQFLSGIH